MQLVNHLGEKFELRIEGKQLDNNKKPIDWWFRSSIIISEKGKKRKTNLKLFTTEDLILLSDWMKEISKGNFEKTIFQFVDGHVWFRIWKKGEERFLRFFIQGDKYRKYRWDWRINEDKEGELLKYIEVLKSINSDFSLKLLSSNK